MFILVEVHSHAKYGSCLEGFMHRQLYFADNSV